MKQLHPLVLIVALALPAVPAASEPVFVTADELSLAKILAPPPGPLSEEQKRDLAELLAIQKARTPPQVERALADASAGVFGFADVLGESFSRERLPKVQELFKKIEGDASAAYASAQNAWNRERPYQVSHEINALGNLPKSPSYPSGASMVGYLQAIILANMLPEKSAAAIFARGRELGDDRLILGLHYPSDVEAGRFAATAAANGFLQKPMFIKEFDEAKGELRRALGL